MNFFKRKQKDQTMYDKIVSHENIEQAYFDLYEIFTEKGKSNKYKPLTGQSISDIEVNVDTVLDEIKDELENLNPLQPAKYIEIPKKNGGIRGIYMLPTKERIKCQAIYRVLEPHFEQIYSDYLYSFRTTRHSYYASRSIKRLYLRNYQNQKGKGDMYILKMDITNYSDYHNHDVLIEIMQKMDVDKNVIALTKLFIKQSYISDGALLSRSVGTMQGMNLCPLFNNIYMDHVDKYVGARVHFYRRVGDDFIMFDRDKKKLEEMRNYVVTEAKKAKILLNRKKEIFGTINENFDFLGLEYENGVVSLPKKSFNSILDSWKGILGYRENMPEHKKMQKLEDFLQISRGSTRYNRQENFMAYVRSYNLVTNREQIKTLSKRFFEIITRFFTGGTSYKNFSKTKNILNKKSFASFSKLHYLYSHGKFNYKNHKRTLRVG